LTQNKVFAILEKISTGLFMAKYHGQWENTMNLKQCFDILELDYDASLEEAKQAYKDIVNVWHPDRFSHSPRLKEKAEKKLKEINVAYARVVSYLSSKAEAKPKTKTQTGGSRRTKTEIAAEAGTYVFMGVCSFLYNAFCHIASKPGIGSGKNDHSSSEDSNSNPHRHSREGKGANK
jgi:DnaJ-class molecular chaperone